MSEDEVVPLNGAMVELKGTKKGRLFLLTIPKAERMVGLPTLQNGVRVSVRTKNEETAML